MASMNVTRPDTQPAATSGAQPATASTREAIELAPPVDIYENEEELLLVVDLPAVTPDSVKIDFDSPELRIRAERGANGTAMTYYRAFRVDERIDPNGIEAELKDGVLRVHLKKSADLKPRRVAVRTN